jgi:hypothetical protein
LSSVRLDPLLQAGVVELAEGGEHVAKRTRLGARRIEPVAETEYQFGGPSFRCGGSWVKCPPAVGAAGGRAFLAKFLTYYNNKGRLSAAS